ncbi:ArsR/SmtB family transcription factor [Bacillus massiliigorillae]|uniref:ArsR/SmtB family transcription factor n=1 Tax=Bacillus massiliigorillae TaxID=1243664 RepID=UPI0003A3F3CE|nr:metalloregulator ArsR/SmtB family transcription factor [Bacillus massiliigorillae]
MSQRTMKILKECTPIFSILSDSNRQEILVLLFDRGEMTVSEITEHIELSRPAVSHHLKLLLQANVVNMKKRSTERYYSLSLDKSINLLKELIQSLEDDTESTK